MGGGKEISGTVTLSGTKQEKHGGFAKATTNNTTKATASTKTKNKTKEEGIP